MSLYWFAHNNNAKLSDAEFLQNLGIKFTTPRGRTEYTRDPDSGDFVAAVGRVFVKTTGEVLIAPTEDAGDKAREQLLRVAVDCVEHDMHKRLPGWRYKRKTTKRAGYWYSKLLLAIDPNCGAGEALAAAHDALKHPISQQGMTNQELAPELFESPKELA